MVNFDSKSNLIFKYKNIKISIPRYSFFIIYATFFAGEYDFLNPRKTDVAIDAGANIGDFTVKIAGKVSSVISIEPSRDNIPYLMLNTKNLHNVMIIEKAVGNKRGFTGFTGRGVSAGVDENTSSRVEIDTLDGLCEDLKLVPTLLKMDIEGSEGDALKGMKNSMNTVRRMVIEVHDEHNKKNCEDTLIRHGFKVRYQNKMDIVKKTLKNITLNPLSFVKYDALNAFYASKRIIKFPLTGKSSIPSCGETRGMYLLEAWK